MSINTNALFATNPRANVPRSRFDYSSGHTTTFDSWQIIPVYWCEILPADSFTVSTAMAVRLQTLLHPIFGDVYCDVDWFFVPNRLLWENWQRFLGENPQPWFENYTTEVPQMSINFKSRTGAYVGSKTIADYLGCPLAPSTGSGTQIETVTHLPFRAYSRIYNEWFRSENLDNMTAFNTSDSGVTMDPTGDPFYGGAPLIANRFADPFSRSLPAPQKGNPVEVALASSAPVVTRAATNASAYDVNSLAPMKWFSFDDGPVWNSGSVSGNSHIDLRGHGTHLTTGTDYYDQYGVARSDSGSITANHLFPANLYADLSNATGVSINELRIAFSTQRYLEALSRGGSRYIEYLSNIWGVTAPDQRLQRSEFLGGNRTRLNVNQVLSQTQNLSGSTGADLGDVGAYSLTTDSQFSFQKSFVEHGILMAVAVVRWNSRYQNGYKRQWFRKKVHDFYNPYLSRIGEQPTTGKEIFADGDLTRDNGVFGYNEAWLEYRSQISTVSAEMRSDISNSLDVWHLADDYSSRPYLNSTWLKGDKGILDRVLAVSSSQANQILADFWFNIDAVRALPIRSIPGLDIL